jgi:hypothetical protein
MIVNYYLLIEMHIQVGKWTLWNIIQQLDNSRQFGYDSPNPNGSNLILTGDLLARNSVNQFWWTKGLESELSVSWNGQIHLLHDEIKGWETRIALCRAKFVAESPVNHGFLPVLILVVSRDFPSAVANVWLSYGVVTAKNS